MQILKRIPYYGALALLAYMPFHIFLSQSSSLLTGGLNEWKIAKDVLLAALTLLTVILVWQQRAMTKTFKWLLGLTTFYAFLHLMLWAAHPHLYRPSAGLGVTYNLRVPCFALLGYGAALLNPGRLTSRFLVRFTLAVSAVVVTLGVAQYFLPKDILTHFGYSVARGVKPNFFIDDKPNLPRIMSTLRDPNSLGAYVLVPIALCSALVLRLKDRRRWIAGGLLVLELAASLLTFSRSAWLAVIMTVALVVWWEYRAMAARMLQREWPVLVVLIILASFGAYAGRHTPFVKSYIIHSTGKPQAQFDSDGFHWYFVKRGVQGIVHNPVGHGPGTAGLASIQNPAGSFLTENYYVQIGYEVGVVGLAAFVALQVLLGMELWRRRDSPLAQALLITIVPYFFVNMLLHIWSNEAVACQWWLLAGFALAMPGRTQNTTPKVDTRTGKRRAISAAKRPEKSARTKKSRLASN